MFSIRCHPSIFSAIFLLKSSITDSHIVFGYKFKQFFTSLIFFSIPVSPNNSLPSCTVLSHICIPVPDYHFHIFWFVLFLFDLWFGLYNHEYYFFICYLIDYLCLFYFIYSFCFLFII